MKLSITLLTVPFFRDCLVKNKIYGVFGSLENSLNAILELHCEILHAFCLLLVFGYVSQYMAFILLFSLDYIYTHAKKKMYQMFLVDSPEDVCLVHRNTCVVCFQRKTRMNVLNTYPVPDISKWKGLPVKSFRVRCECSSSDYCSLQDRMNRRV